MFRLSFSPGEQYTSFKVRMLEAEKAVGRGQTGARGNHGCLCQRGEGDQVRFCG